MATQDLLSLIKGEIAFDIQSISSDTTTNGNNIDMSGFQSLTFYLITGTITDGDYTVLIEEADDDGSGSPDSFSAVADADLLPTGTGQEADASFDADTDDDSISEIGYRGTKRWLRFSIVSTNTTTGGTLGAVAIKGHPADSSNT